MLQGPSNAPTCPAAFYDFQGAPPLALANVSCSPYLHWMGQELPEVFLQHLPFRGDFDGHRVPRQGDCSLILLLACTMSQQRLQLEAHLPQHQNSLGVSRCLHYASRQHSLGVVKQLEPSTPRPLYSSWPPASLALLWLFSTPDHVLAPGTAHPKAW